MILEKNINGCDARISFKNNKSIVAIDNKINSIKRQNFILAHELAHFELHRSIITEIHIDNYNSLNSWFSGGHHEIEANYFAGELLMPKEQFKTSLTNEQFSLDSIINLSNLFESSLTATALQFIKYGNFPICIVQIINSVINWCAISEDFPLKYIEKGDLVSPYTVAGEIFSKGKIYDSPEEIKSSAWFSKDFEFEKHQQMELFEQCFRTS